METNRLNDPSLEFFSYCVNNIEGIKLASIALSDSIKKQNRKIFFLNIGYLVLMTVSYKLACKVYDLEKERDSLKLRKETEETTEEK